MKVTLFVLIGLFPISLLMGEGIPINEARTKCEASHYLVKATEEQKEELAVCGTLTLTSEQWKAARSKFPSTPKRIPLVLPCTFNDCSCGLNERHWGIWFADGSVAILSEGEESIPFRDLPDESKRQSPPRLEFRMDTRGQFYHSNRLVPFPEVKDRVSNKLTTAENSGDLYLIIEIPPGASRKDAALAKRIDELEELAKDAGRGFHVLWEH